MMTDEKKVQEAYDQCLNYLSFKNRTESEMVQYLEKKSYSERIIAAVMQKLCHYGFVDDRKYVQNYCEQNKQCKFWGRKKMQWDLKKRGISENDLQLLDDYFCEDEEKRCCEHHFEIVYRQTQGDLDLRRRNKIFMNLQRKGFGNQIIREVMAERMPERVWEDMDETDSSSSANRAELIRYYEKYERMQRRKGYEGRELQQRIIRNLMGRGYRYDAIKGMIREREED